MPPALLLAHLRMPVRAADHEELYTCDYCGNAVMCNMNIVHVTYSRGAAPHVRHEATPVR